MISSCFDASAAQNQANFLFFVDIHVVVDGNLTVKEGHKIGHDVKDYIMQHKPLIYNVLTHIEPSM